MHDSIQKLIETAINERTFPGAIVAYANTTTMHILPFGHYTYDKNSPRVTESNVYDLASLTKVIPTNSIILHLIESGLLSAEDSVARYIPELENPDKDAVLVKHLLTFTVLFDLPDRLTTYTSGGATAVLNAIYKAPLKYPPGQHYQYSDAPSMLLTIIAERILHKRLDVAADELFFRPLGMTSTTFHPETLDHSLIVPTEINHRGEVRGQAHDEKAWTFHKEGLISGNAGLFSSAKDLLIFGQMLLANGTYGGHEYFKPSTVKLMSTELLNNGTFGMSLGWEMNQADYMSPNISRNVFGKDGFTGTMLLVDPVKNICVVMLANRTYPQRPPSPEPIYAVRRQLADIILT